MARYNEEVLVPQGKPEKQPERILPKPGEYTPDHVRETKNRPWGK